MSELDFVVHEILKNSRVMEDKDITYKFLNMNKIHVAGSFKLLQKALKTKCKIEDLKPF